MTPEEIIEVCRTDPGTFLELTTFLDGKPTRLEPYQRRYTNDQSIFRIVNKSRQIGFSTIMSGEAFARAALQGGYKANFVSINKSEASDKIDIAKNFYYSMPDELVSLGLKPERPWNDGENELSFFGPPHTSSIISQPASAAVRGGQKDIYFDEFAHIRDARKLYQAATPAITRGDSRLTIVSTPLGQSGLFHDIFTDTSSYPQYSRHSVPWFECSAMVRPERLEEAVAMAGDPDSLIWNMGSEERVVEFGTDKLKIIFDGFGGDVQSFQTEYEATFVDETDAYYVWELIVANTATLDEQNVWKVIPPGWSPEGTVTIGVDLAKKRDETVFTVVEHAPDGVRHVRYVKATRSSYDEQFDELKSLAVRTKASRVSIDETGLGQVFVERAKQVDGIRNAEGVSFSNSIKERWATTFKGDLQKGAVRLLDHPVLKRQIHGIRRTRTDSGLFRFEGKPHDDYFWSLLLGLYGRGRRPSAISSL